jgi:phosphoribosylaminoimidazolecarboxamide formyltransferase/IMP cyclohydrolase
VDEYSLLLDLITDQDGATTLADRKLLTKAFHVSSHYDISFNYFNTDETIFKASIADGKPEIWRKSSSKGFFMILTPCLINYTEKNYHTITYLM